MASWSTSASLQLRHQRPPLSLAVGKPPSLRIPSRIHCGLRGAGERKPLWRGRVMSREAIQVVQALKLAKLPSSSRPIDDVLDARLGRLLKADQIAVLAELRRQNEWQLALQVFAFIRKEGWCKPELSLYGDMIFMLGKNKLIEHAEELFYELQNEGLQPDTRIYTEMIGAFLQVNMVEKAMDLYKSMKDSGCKPSKLTLTILIRNLEKVGLEDLASDVKKDCEEYVDCPEKFLEEVGKKYPKRRSLKIV